MTKTQPLVSICIPTYNRENIIAHTIESVIRQTYENIEIIISDNCSTDRTYEIIKAYASKDKRIKCYQQPENTGPVQNWKNCQRKSTGEFVKFLWSDDYIDNIFIEKTVDQFSSNIGFVFTPVKWFEVGTMNVNHEHIGYKLGSDTPRTIDSFIELLLLKGDVPVSGSCALFRKTVIDDLFNESITNCLGLDCDATGAGIDSLMFLYAYKKYEKFAYLDDIHSYFGVDASSITIKEGNKLTPYYFSTFYNFLIRFRDDEQLQSKFKSRVLFYKIFMTKDKPTLTLLAELCDMMRVKVDVAFLFKMVVKNIIDRFPVRRIYQLIQRFK